ncbi:MAG: porin [Sphingobium sp.]|uniref:OprO/OprP family phosphate-selective porin n=1 Tax=Sphingobium sp. TaxID=1912891 RepID=UPI0029B8972D|nr:porin [Sphingobium sp.]MDX3909870.1 porin [Sphingobium sp.]
MKYRQSLLATAMLMAAAPTAAAAQGLSAQEAADLRAQVAALKAQVDRLEARLNAVPPSGDIQSASTPPANAATPPKLAVAEPEKPKTNIKWKGAPQLSLGDATFKVSGRIQIDGAYLSVPDSVNDRAQGYSNEIRRLRFGASGVLGGGFGYKLDAELSDNTIDIVDTYITYQNKKLLVTFGNQNQFQSLDELISDSTGSVMERAAFTDAFGFERRLGLSVQYRSKLVVAQGGIFSDSIDSLSNSSDGVAGGDENNSFGLDGRIVIMPKVGDLQLHFGGSYHWRDFQRLSEAPVRYRQRPYTHTANSRFLSTPNIKAEGERHYGFELAGSRGRLFFAGEGHWLRASRRDLADPTFFGAYAEVGYFLTKGDTRPLEDGIFGRTDPANPVSEGGPGAWQIAFRYDYLNLNDKGIVGGTQNAYIAGLVWTPINYLRFNANYAHLVYTDAAILAGDRADYSADVMALRAELDF